MTLIKSISGIRGTIGGAIGKNLTPIDIVKFTTAYAQFLAFSLKSNSNITIVIGREVCDSAVMIYDIVEGTILGCGINVINEGICTISAVELAVIQHKAQGGIFITSSQNPQQCNALRLINANGEFLNDEECNYIFTLAKKNNYIYPDLDKLGNVKSQNGCNPIQVIQALTTFMMDTETLKSRKLSIMMDAAPTVQQEVASDDWECNKLSTDEMSLDLESNTSIENKIQEWVDNKKYLSNGISIQTLANNLFTNRTYLSKHINNRYGCTFRNWILELRLNEAKEIISKDPNIHIVDVAIKVGFSSPASFTRAFTRKEGVSPLKWREKNTNEVKLM